MTELEKENVVARLTNIRTIARKAPVEADVHEEIQRNIDFLANLLLAPPKAEEKIQNGNA